jgi:hypothetical protein
MAPSERILNLGLVVCCGLSACGDDGSSGTPFTGVKGSARDRYRTETGEVVVAPEAARWSSIAAHPLAAGPIASYPGTLSAEGDIAIADLPEGPYLLELASPGPAPFRSFYELSARTFDLSRLFSRRPDARTMTRPTGLVVVATLDRPWQADVLEAVEGGRALVLNDGLLAYSRNAGVAGLALGGANGLVDAPIAGATALAWPIDAKALFASHLGAGNERLVDAAGGDDFALLHQVVKVVRAPGPAPAGGDPWHTYPYSSAEAVLRPPPFTMTDGGSSTVTGAFEALPQKTFALDYEGARFNELLRDAPGVELSGTNLSFAVYHEPNAPEPSQGATADLLGVALATFRVPVNPMCNSDDPQVCADTALCPDGCNRAETLALPGDHAQRYSYGNPFASGRELASLRYGFRAILRDGLPEGETPERVRGEFTVRAPADELNGRPLAPAMGLPRNVTVNGEPTPFDRVRVGVGTTPVVAFEPPALGTPTYYEIYVVETDDRKDAAGRFAEPNRRLASVRTTRTALSVPAGVLEAGKHYYLLVTAAADDGPADNPFRTGLHAASATTFTGIFTP